MLRMHIPRESHFLQGTETRRESRDSIFLGLYFHDSSLMQSLDHRKIPEIESSVCLEWAHFTFSLFRIPSFHSKGNDFSPCKPHILPFTSTFPIEVNSQLSFCRGQLNPSFFCASPPACHLLFLTSPARHLI